MKEESTIINIKQFFKVAAKRLISFMDAKL
jgi:hypothetical protein